MNSLPDSEILVVTTHYPFGTIEENWIAQELKEFALRFSRVIVLPVKELDGRRDLPEGTELWPPLATLNRRAFFARHGLTQKTLRYFIDAIRECASGPGITVARAIVCFKFACYRVAFERNTLLKLFLSSNKPKIVYAYWGHLAALAIPMAREMNAATCVRFHRNDLYVHQPETGGFFPWRRELRVASNLNAFVSDHGRKYYLGLSGGQPTGVNTVFRLGSGDRGLPGSRVDSDPVAPIVMVSASWIQPVKRVELIAQLAGELATRRSVIWHHFGSGSYPGVDAHISRARSMGAQIVLHGQVTTERLQEFYRENPVTFFVNLSRSEGIPVSIMEALNADIPIVATAVDGTPEIVFEGRSGLLVAPELPGGPAALAARILGALAPGGLLTGLKPREVWSELCDAQALAKLFAQELSALAYEHSS